MTSLFGADVARYQTTTPTRGLSFIFAKATEGASYVDPMYAKHAANTLSAGLHLGAYLFTRSDVGIDEQARFFVAHATGAKALVVDVEPSTRGPNLPPRPALSRTQTRALIAAIKLHDPLHRKVGLYMSESGFYDATGADFRWVANWSHSPNIPYDIHQYSASPFDQDVAKDQATLDRIFGTPVTAAPHYAATVIVPTNVYNPRTRRWVYNGRNVLKVGTKLVIRGAKYLKGGVVCYPIMAPPLYAGDYVPVAHVKLGARVP